MSDAYNAKEAAREFIRDTASEGDRCYFTRWTPEAEARLAEWLRAASRGEYVGARLYPDTFRDDGATTPEGCEDERQGEVPGA